MFNSVARGAMALAVMAAMLLLGGCGGGGDSEGGRSPLRAPSATITPSEAARQLMDYAENVLPTLFPGHETTRSLSAFAFRYYPATGIYLGVVVNEGTPFVTNGVYVMGGPFGSAPFYVGPLTQFVTPVDPNTVIVDSFGQVVAGGSDGVGNGDSGADGTAGDGAPIVGATVTVTDVNGRSVSAVTDSVGHYRVKVTGFTPPFVARLTRPDGTRTFHSLNLQQLRTNGYVTMNVTGLTDKIVSDVARAAGRTGASQLTPQLLAANTTAVATAITNLRNAIEPLLDAAGLSASNFNPITLAFRPDHTGYDNVLDNVTVTVAPDGSTQVTPTNTTNSSRCPALASGQYWMAANFVGVSGGTNNLLALTLDLAARTGSISNAPDGTHNFTLVPETDAAGTVPCAYNFVQSGTTQFTMRMSEGGLAAIAAPLSSTTGTDLGVAVPVQNLTLADVAGTWYAAGIDRETVNISPTSSAQAWVPGFTRLDITSQGVITATECAGTSPQGATTPALGCNQTQPSGTVSAGGSPGLFMVRNNNNTIWVGAYRAPNGDMAFVAQGAVGTGNDRMFAVGSKRVSSVTRTQGETWQVANWNMSNSPNGVRVTGRDFTFTVTSVDSTGKRVTRVDNSSPPVTDMVVYDSPFPGTIWRPATSTSAEWVAVSGKGWAAISSTNQSQTGFYGLSITR